MTVTRSINWWWNEKLPVILQTEAAECGLACLAMISAFYGACESLSNLRQKFPISRKGATLEQIVSIGSKLNLMGRPIRLELEEIPQLKTPCILHWNLNHFVVLSKTNSDSIEIVDPARGRLCISMKEVSKSFTGVALELIPAPSFELKAPPAAISIGSLVGSVVGLRRSVLQVLALSVALEFFATVSPFFQQWIIDGVIASSDTDLLLVLCGGLLLLVFLQVTVSAFRSLLVTYFSTSLSIQWMSGLFSKLTKLPPTYFERRQLGDVVSRFDSIHAIQQVLTTAALSSILDGIMALLSLLVMLFYSVKLALISLIALLFYVVIRVLAYGPFKSANEEQLVHSAKEHSHFLESIRGMQSIKLFNKEDSRRSQWLNLVVNTTNRSLATQRMSTIFTFANGLLFGAESILVLYFSARMTIGNTFSVGMLFAYNAYKNQFSSRIGSLVDLYFNVRMLRIQKERLADIVTSIPDQIEGSLDVDEAIAASIEFRNIRFRYSELEPWIIDGVSLKIEPGESVVFVGASGCGKTTLLKLALGLLNPTEGEILIGGIPLCRIGLQTYRNMVGAVMQDDQLFAGSIAENIAFADESIDKARIESCAKLSAIHDDISNMPMMYQTLVGEMGGALSGGQRQRLLLARALYKRPQILFLDEATSNLDVGTERLVNESIRRMRITKVVIAHRPETIAMARRVVSLENGKVMQDFRQISAPQITSAANV